MRVGVKQADRCASIRCSKTKESWRESIAPRPASPETETQGDALLSCLPRWGPRLRSIPTITEEWFGLLGLPGWHRDDEASVGNRGKKPLLFLGCPFRLSSRYWYRSLTQLYSAQGRPTL